MENQLEIIKSNLPYGYEGSIAKEAGCSKGTVHNILNNKPASARSSYKAKVLTIATRMAKEALEASKGVSKAAAELETLQMELQANNELTKRENQIAGLAFCGLAKKEMADRLHVAYGTINVLLDKAYKKTGTSKLNELGSWWANRVFTLNIDFQQLQKRL